MVARHGDCDLRPAVRARLFAPGCSHPAPRYPVKSRRSLGVRRMLRTGAEIAASDRALFAAETANP
ncbi:MAG: hypothetical protein PHT60_06350 [Acidiphilium sp.]|nr:hypothetical protein [Acidiphilium sp.]